jgi:hypothetical protein
MSNSQISKAASLMGRRSYRVRVDKFGIERIREIARENGKHGGRPRKEKRNGN